MRKKILHSTDKIVKARTFVSLESDAFRYPMNLSLIDFTELLDIKFNPANVILTDFSNQGINKTLPPGARSLDSKLELASDDNFLYIWKKDKWKRIPLSDF